jgi:hypothetical protein
MLDDETRAHLASIYGRPQSACPNHDYGYRRRWVSETTHRQCSLGLTASTRLNLATANRVFIFEPQWNPSVENQAIARALRLGQKQAVLVTRYVVEQTVEQVRRISPNTLSLLTLIGNAHVAGYEARKS